MRSPKPDPPSPTGGGGGQLVISATEPIRSFLLSAAKDPNLSQPLRDLASSLCSQDSIHYSSLRSIWVGSSPSARPELIRLFCGTQFLLTSPKPREKSEELKARLKKLEEMAERKAYEELVKDITPGKNASEDEPFSSYKDQLGFGLHVALIMFTGYLVGYAAFRAMFSHNPAMSAAGGILGLVGGMLVETLLFIIRTSSRDPKPKSKSSASTSEQKKNQ
ncbi:hypothetical protein Tsubulata_014537 [Turnera subulata]|uniref:ATPase, vacuolar ER assembly factor, Vma12 n=1 Tax=Turnera subulata TaxID=218843 RepID=A0A9Q0J5S0_9ROSI|nr:hypothetical protein Tsubulata_014537 [Turnera subulata]